MAMLKRWRALAVTVAVGSGVGTAAFAQCTPFGDAPARMTGNPVPTCPGGSRLGPWPDANGTPRYACLFNSAAAGAKGPLPLVVFLHPSLVTADSLVTGTNILAFQADANLNDDPDRPGFIVLAPEGRTTTHFYPAPDDNAPGWDNWYRQVSAAGTVTAGGVAYPENVDSATIDHFVAQEIASGEVDTDRIFLTGWSNGSAMAYLYGLNRTNIAAIAVYSSPDPFGAFNDPCEQVPVTEAERGQGPGTIPILAPAVPAYEVHNSCDIDGLCPNSELTHKQIRAIGGHVMDTIIDTDQSPANGCNLACGTNPNADPSNQLGSTLGAANHLRWPTLWTAAMLDFFRQHPLSDRPAPSAVDR
jgi:predicted esterase